LHRLKVSLPVEVAGRLRRFGIDTGSRAVRLALAHLLPSSPLVDHRPWGYFVVLADEPDHKVKRIVVYPGKRLSLQRHHKRAEHWFVVQGEALAVRDDDEILLHAGQAVDIPRGAWHRIRNPGDRDMAFVEVQTGDYFGEDDIERREDDFGRA
jgi:mannose-6-phosphate isomerase